MTIQIISFGKMGAEYKPLLDHWRKMIKPKLVEHELVCRKALDPLSLKMEEASMVMQLLPKNTALIALDPLGREMTSEQISSYMQKIVDASRSITFVIGGAYGLDKSITTKADLVLSLSQMTMPHLLAKLVLVEQIYRAQTISAGHPYHK
jgi:23S rRNA (pseudouridine1915-N3)-methyltransferase